MMKGGKAGRRIKLAYAVLLLLFSLVALSWLVSATDERQPQPCCWKRRVWGLRYGADDRREDRCITAFINAPHMSRIPISSALRRAAEQDKSNQIIDIIDSDGDDEQDTSSSSSTFRQKSKDEWIDGRKMMQLMELEKAKEQQERQRQRDIALFNNRFQQPPSASLSQRSIGMERVKAMSTFVSRMSYTDANTLQIELPPPGVDASVFFSGAFSALWFSAVGPATLGMLSGGIASALFMVPFWLAGGMVAKMAVVDPFVSSKLTIGDYLWTLEKSYFRRIGKLTSKKQDGPTETLKVASVEVVMLVNNVPRYVLRLFFDDGKTISFGNGLSFDELEHLAETINEHCTKIGETPRLQQ